MSIFHLPQSQLLSHHKPWTLKSILTIIPQHQLDIYRNLTMQLFLQRLQSSLLMKQGQASTQWRAVRTNLKMYSSKRFKENNVRPAVYDDSSAELVSIENWKKLLLREMNISRWTTVVDLDEPSRGSSFSPGWYPHECRSGSWTEIWNFRMIDFKSSTFTRTSSSLLQQTLSSRLPRPSPQIWESRSEEMSR